jgi:4-amino-4-deoxy-L-arabinose transferase-like glycosyltransferase
MSRAPEQPVDPLRWCGALALAFWLATLPFLTVVPHAYFDEVHYLPAARELLVLGEFTNREHPLVGKELIALGIALFGDNPWGWRLLPTLFGTLALFANMRALWFATCSRFATLAYGVLLATGFHLFVHARIAMLDIFYLAFLSLAAWQFAAAIRQPEQGRWRLALTGVALGLAMGSKWNALVVATLPGLNFLIARALAGRRRLLLSSVAGGLLAACTNARSSVESQSAAEAQYADTDWRNLTEAEWRERLPRDARGRA